jgi:GrpB-like predicted nucleotidyltransferase (UPF0157 family)
MNEGQNTLGHRTSAGLCADCVHARAVESVRGSAFLLCNLSFADARFPKYPRLPVLSCSGYRSKTGESAKPIIVVDYDPQWPATFETLRSKLAEALGSLVAAIEHIGSTSVPGLVAKPIIDIDMLLKSASDLPLVIQRLASLGYAHRGDLGVEGREAFATPPGAHAHHLYVCPPESREYRRHLALRDYLRTHSKEAAAYGKLKRSLAAHFRDDRSAYNNGKSEFVESLLQKALAAPPPASI